MIPRATARCLAVAWLSLLGAACRGGPAAPVTGEAPPPTAPAAVEFRAQIRWTSYGIPHITADDLGSLAFGQGWAFASLHGCVLADQVTMLRSERAKFFGPGEGDANVESDFGYLALGLRAQAEAAMPRISKDARDVLRGFAAGYNRYLTDGKHLPAACLGEPWVRPIDEIDVAAYGLHVLNLTSGVALLGPIASAQPPTGGEGGGGVPGGLPSAPEAGGPGSNAWAIGADRAASGHGMLVANPHYPWEGALRFYESHLTIPGRLDAYGATVLGLPLLTIGFNRSAGWTHTYSSARQFVLYRLTLDPTDPTRYRFGDETRPLERREYAVQVKQPDGSLREVRRTLYRSHHGPIVAAGPMAWDRANAFAMRSVGTSNLFILDQYLAMMLATDVAGIRAALARYRATPFINTIAADAAGDVWYADGSSVPALSAGALGAWQMGRRAIPALEAAWQQGVVVVDGALPMFELEHGDDPVVPGAIPFDQAPQLARRDFVANANDPYWLTNPAAPLTGFSPLYGEIERPASKRWRMNLRLLGDTSPDGPAGADGRFDAAELEAAIRSDRGLTVELWREPVLKSCRVAAAGNRGDARLRSACDVLEAWDGRFHTDSRGALLWRQILEGLPPQPWATPFDPKHPVDTPTGLAATDAQVKGAIVGALDRMAVAGIAPDAPLGSVQFTEKWGRRIAVPGGFEGEGVTNPAFHGTFLDFTLAPRMDPGQPQPGDPTGLTLKGYPVNFGTSFLLVLAFGDDGPAARAILTYSQSSDPVSPHFADQTELWSKGQLREVRFREADVAADPALRVETVTGR